MRDVFRTQNFAADDLLHVIPGGCSEHLVRQELSTTPSAGSVASERAQWRWVSPRDEPRSAKRYGRGFGRFVEVACHEGWGVKKASFDQLVNSWWAAASVSASVPSRAPSASPYRAEPASTRVVGRHGRKCTRGRRVDDVVDVVTTNRVIGWLIASVKRHPGDSHSQHSGRSSATLLVATRARAGCMCGTRHER